MLIRDYPSFKIYFKAYLKYFMSFGFLNKIYLLLERNPTKLQIVCS